MQSNSKVSFEELSNSDRGAGPSLQKMNSVQGQMLGKREMDRASMDPVIHEHHAADDIKRQKL